MEQGVCMKRGVGIALLLFVIILGGTTVFVLSRETATAASSGGEIIFVSVDFVDDPPNHKWNTIREGVADASRGDIIYVFPGTYNESVYITKKNLELRGTAPQGVTIQGTSNYAVNITANGVTLSNFTIEGAAKAAIDCHGHNFALHNCRIRDVPTGVGIRVSSYNYNIYSRYDNVVIQNCSFHTLHTAVQFRGNHLSVHDSTLYDSEWGIVLQQAQYCDLARLDINNIENKTVKVDACRDVLIRDVFLRDSFCGIWLNQSEYVSIYNATLEDNMVGARVLHTQFATVSHSSFLNNQGYGLYVADSGDNAFYYNNFIDNDWNAYSTGFGNNRWNATAGNYWDDYTGSDENGDGIGDGGKYIAGSYDYKPLMQPVTTPPRFVWVDDDYNQSTLSWGVDHFATLQAGVDAVADGGTVCLLNGAYHEEIDIRTPLTLTGRGNVTLSSSGNAITIHAGDVRIEGLTVSPSKNGIVAQHIHNVTVHDCHIREATFGVYLVDSVYCAVTNTTLTDNQKGINIFNTSHSRFSGNGLYDNAYFGMELSHHSSHNNISDCHLQANQQYGVYIAHQSSHNVIQHNNFIQNPAYDACTNQWGAPREKALGNYWSDYQGGDSNNDGMGDTPYHLEGGEEEDPHPLLHELPLAARTATLSDKWALICVSANDYSGEDCDQHQWKANDYQLHTPPLWQEFVPQLGQVDGVSLYMGRNTGTVPPLTVSIKNQWGNEVATNTWDLNNIPPNTYYLLRFPLSCSVTPGGTYRISVSWDYNAYPDAYFWGGTAGNPYLNGTSSPVYEGVTGWDFTFGTWYSYEWYDADGFPAQGLQAYYTLKKHGYRDDHIIFMLWHDDEEYIFSGCEPDEDNDGTDEYISIYGGHNDLNGPPPEIGGPDEQPEIDFHHPNKTVLRQQLGNLSAKVQPDDEVLIYLGNHGEEASGDFCFETGERLSGDEMAQCVAPIADNCSKVTLLSDFCYSALFNQNLDAALQSRDTTLVSATGTCTGYDYPTAAAQYPWAGSYFFHPFFARLDQGATVQEAYQHAYSYRPWMQVENVSQIQHPGLIDNRGDSAVSSFLQPSPHFTWVNKDFTSSYPGWRMDHFHSVQQGIYGVDNGGGCYAFPGVYRENVVIDKPVTVTGEVRNTTIVEGRTGSGFTLFCSDIALHGFDVRTSWSDPAIDVAADNATITDCVLADSYYGIRATGNDTLLCNTTLRDNANVGASWQHADRPTMRDCSVYGNNKGVVLSGVRDGVFAHMDVHNNSVYGIELSASVNTTFHHVSFLDNMYGIYADASTDNLFYFNDFIRNSQHAWDNGNNSWDNGTVGNYWDDHPGGSRIKGTYTTPYEIPGGDNVDRHPLIRRAGLPVPAFKYSPGLPFAAETVTFTDTSIDLDGSVVQRHWTFGDGSPNVTTTDAVVTHTYMDDGTYQVTLTVTDDDGNTGTATKPITVLNTPPTAAMTWEPLEPTDVDTIAFNGSNSTDPDGAIVSYEWHFGDNTTGYGVNATHRYPDNGTYRVTLTVTDDDNETDTVSTTIEVHNVQPNASFAVSPATPSTADTISFTDTSTDPDGAIVSYEWHFGDGTTSYDSNPVHRYPDNGTYQVTLTVRDDDNATATASRIITVTNVAPSANFTYDPEAPSDIDVVAFDASNSTDPDGSIETWHWAFGDGDTSTSQKPRHTFPDDGVYTVNLTVWDDDGASNTTSQTVKVYNVPPQPRIGYRPAEPTTLDTIVMEAGDSTDPDGSIVSYEWRFGDGNTSTGRTVMHSYDSDGFYTVTLNVTDDDGATGTTTTSLLVVNKPPLVNFSVSPAQPTDVADVSFAGNATDPDGAIANYTWRFGDNTTGYGVNATHRYPDNGTYQVTLTVTDDDGGSTSYTRDVTVSNVPPQPSFTYEPAKPTAGKYVTFRDTSTDPDGEVVNATWHFGDGSIEANGDLLNHKYGSPGSYTVKLVVTDDDGATANTTRTVTVTEEDQAAGFEFIVLVAAIGILLFMWKRRMGVWRRR